MATKIFYSNSLENWRKKGSGRLNYLKKKQKKKNLLSGCVFTDFWKELCKGLEFSLGRLFWFWGPRRCWAHSQERTVVWFPVLNRDFKDNNNSQDDDSENFKKWFLLPNATIKCEFKRSHVIKSESCWWPIRKELINTSMVTLLKKNKGFSIL